MIETQGLKTSEFGLGGSFALGVLYVIFYADSSSNFSDPVRITALIVAGLVVWKYISSRTSVKNGLYSSASTSLALNSEGPGTPAYRGTNRQSRFP